MIKATDLAALAGVPLSALPAERPLEIADLCSWPNAITLSGYAAGIAWLAGGGPALAFWSILADELDGLSARNLGEASPVGDRLDHSVDICLLALAGMRVGLGWVALPLTLLGQVFLKERGYSPSFGSTRAAVMAYALL